MRRMFEEDLQELHAKFSEMGMMVNEAILKSVQAFVNHDKVLAQEVIDSDHLINEYEIDLEKRSFELIALQQPVTTDLRVIVTVLKASSDLERMADHAVSIAESTIRVKGNKRVPEIEEQIGEMADVVKEMADAVLDAYVKGDPDRAKEIARKDDKVDAHFTEIYRQCIEEMKNNPETVVGASDYMMVAGYLERLGDYVTNICEWIVYLSTGKVSELNTHAE